MDRIFMDEYYEHLRADNIEAFSKERNDEYVGRAEEYKEMCIRDRGKTVAQCLADRTDYSQNAAKTNDGEFISSYECDPKTADEEFLLSKRQYQHINGRQQKNNIIRCV